MICFGEMIGNRRQAWMLYGVMGALCCCWLCRLPCCRNRRGTPTLARAGIETAATVDQPGGNMEGKEVRFGIAESSLFGDRHHQLHDRQRRTRCMTASRRSARHPTFIGMMLQCVFGGKGVGFLAALVYGMIAVFVAGLMVGRTPDFSAKRSSGRRSFWSRSRC